MVGAHGTAKDMTGFKKINGNNCNLD